LSWAIGRIGKVGDMYERAGGQILVVYVCVFSLLALAEGVGGFWGRKKTKRTGVIIDTREK